MSRAGKDGQQLDNARQTVPGNGIDHVPHEGHILPMGQLLGQGDFPFFKGHPVRPFVPFCCTKVLPVNLSVMICSYAATCWGNHRCSHCWLSSTTFKMPSALLPVGLQLIPLCF